MAGGAMGLTGMSSGMPPQQPEEDLWAKLAEFKFSELSKEDKSRALSLALMASGGAMLSAPSLMQGMGAASTAFANTYGAQTNTLQGDNRAEDQMRYRGLLAQAGKADYNARFRESMDERKRATGVSELASKEAGSRAEAAGVRAEEGLDLQKQSIAMQESARALAEQRHNDQQEALIRILGPEAAGLTPSGAASIGLGGGADKDVRFNSIIGGYRYNPESDSLESNELCELESK